MPQPGDLSSLARQPVDAVHCLRRSMATLLCSLDDAVVRPVRIEQFIR